jgi:hypothetical protein
MAYAGIWLPLPSVEVVSDSSRGSESEIEEAQLITILEEDNGTLVPITW